MLDYTALGVYYHQTAIIAMEVGALFVGSEFAWILCDALLRESVLELGKFHIL